MNKEDILREAQKITWDKGRWAVFGGGILAVRGMRETADLDLVVTKDLWDQLVAEGNEILISEAEGNHNEREHLKIDGLDIWYNLPYLRETGDELVGMSEIIEGIPFVPMAKLKEFKEGWRRSKDVKDLELIRDWEENHSQG